LEARSQTVKLTRWKTLAEFFVVFDEIGSKLGGHDTAGEVVKRRMLQVIVPLVRERPGIVLENVSGAPIP
jgi:hypothetical protein